MSLKAGLSLSGGSSPFKLYHALPVWYDGPPPYPSPLKGEGREGVGKANNDVGALSRYPFNHYEKGRNLIQESRELPV
jgi:hypothetical protein